jgi:hypothetical protein
MRFSHRLFSCRASHEYTNTIEMGTFYNYQLHVDEAKGLNSKKV